MKIQMNKRLAIPALAAAFLAACSAQPTVTSAAAGDREAPAATPASPAVVAPAVHVPAARSTDDLAADRALEDKYGVRAVSVRPVAGGSMVYFRYKVVDAARAKPLLEAKLTPILKDHATGASLSMPRDSKIGALRSSPKTDFTNGKEYFVLFNNSQLLVRTGSAVDVAMGDCVFKGLVVD